MQFSTNTAPLSPAADPSSGRPPGASPDAGDHHPSPLPAITARSALFLDFDGTLADLAPQPEAVRVVDGLVDTLLRLSDMLGGALAIVSGRTVRDLDHFLSPVQFPLAAEHGAQRRLASGDVKHVASADLTAIVRQVEAFAKDNPGLRVEAKSAAVALHYRHAPDLEMPALKAMLDASKTQPGLDLLRGKFVYEIKPAGVSKGTALKDFMAQPPFRGREPLFAGDDVTDEAGFEAVQSMGGFGIKVGPGATAALHRCASPDALRHWLAAARDSMSLPELPDQAPAHSPRTTTP